MVSPSSRWSRQKRHLRMWGLPLVPGSNLVLLSCLFKSLTFPTHTHTHTPSYSQSPGCEEAPPQALSPPAPARVGLSPCSHQTHHQYELLLPSNKITPKPSDLKEQSSFHHLQWFVGPAIQKGPGWVVLAWGLVLLRSHSYSWNPGGLEHLGPDQGSHFRGSQGVFMGLFCVG